VPVDGLTEDSQRAFEENFRTYTMKKEERMKQLLDITESIDGQSQQSMLIPDTITQKPLPEEEEEAVVKDEVRAGREQFLKIYKEKEPKEGDKGQEDSGPKEIKFRREESSEDMESVTG
jgi:hypothetical protein